SQTRSVTVTVASYIPPTPIINCAITNFTASPTSIISGSGATLVWNTSGCTNVSILNSNLFYYVAPTSGTEIVYPTTTTTYTLTAYGSNWVEQTRSVTVTVATGYVPPVQNCTISDFTANGTSISANGSSTLSWNTNNCASATISNLPYNVPVSGNQVIYPTATTTYTLTAYGINGTSQTRSVTVSVASYIPPTPIVNCSISNFNANTNNINISNPVTLTWNTANCTNANISNIGSVAIAGSQTVYPSVTTTYTLTAYGSNWVEQTRSVTVVVNNYIPGIVNNCIISSFYASPTSINSNNYSSLYWTTNNCTSVTISNLGYNVPLSGNQTVYPNQTTTYTLTAYGSNGSAQNQTATISVINTNNNQSCYISNFTASPSVVTSGSPVTLTWNTNGCTSANINGIGNVALSGNQTIYPTYSTNYILNAYGYNNTQQSQTAYVAVNPVVVVQQPPIQQPVYNVCAVTTIATNVGQNSAQLNGLITSGTGSMTTYFEYGPTVSMGYRTQSRSVNANSSFNEFISGLAPDTIYYFRFISTCANGAQSQGTIEIFETLRTPTVSSSNRNQQTTVVRPVIVQGTTVIGTSSPIMLKIENRYEAIGIGDTIDYTVTYKNIGSSLLTRPILQVIAPKDITLTNASRGTYAPDTNTLTVELEDLYPNAEGVVFIQGRVDSIPVNTAQIVTTAVLVYTSPSGAQENAIAYVLNKPKDIFNNNNLGASAFFAGIFPSTLIGWLLLIKYRKHTPAMYCRGVLVCTYEFKQKVIYD
ncbi:DUF11 domain-containing protein, partial [Candidatus Nomurabacteria bacterium]|nr:DUF11 domain-containing protein [Candidatus Nomurabacteria bacterium]